MNELEPEMIKLLKLVSFLSIAIAIAAVVIAGIGLTRDNSTVRERAEFLAEPTIIDKLREIENLPDTKKDKVSPLVTQSIDFALRIDPPPPPKPTVIPGSKTPAGEPDINEIQKLLTELAPPRDVKFNLVATCRYENFPEKSLALFDITSKGNQWVRQGDMVGRHEIHQINDGSVVVYQNGKESGVLYVPVKNSVSTLLKSRGEMVTATVSPPAATNTAGLAKPVNAAKTPPHRRSVSRQSTGSRPATRKLPAKPTAEQSKKIIDKDVSEIVNILDKTIIESKENPGNSDELMEKILKMLESSSKKQSGTKKK